MYELWEFVPRLLRVVVVVSLGFGRRELAVGAALVWNLGIWIGLLCMSDLRVDDGL